MSAGDVSKAKFLRETLNVADAAAANFGGDGMDSPEVWARYLSNISNLARLWSKLGINHFNIWTFWHVPQNKKSALKLRTQVFGLFDPPSLLYSH